jgi:hypothetical protein
LAAAAAAVSLPARLALAVLVSAVPAAAVPDHLRQDRAPTAALAETVTYTFGQRAISRGEKWQ